MDFATASVMLARAAGLPSRLAVGYLPGDRDLLSGAYSVRDSHAHAWSEVLFREYGWVPFDGTDRPDQYVAGRATGGQVPGLRHLFESSVGDDLLQAVVVGPARLASGLTGAFSNPVSTALASIAVGALLVALAWLGARLMWKRRKPVEKRWSYTRLPGGGRDEMLRMHRRVEKLLRKSGSQPRKPWQTAGDYAAAAAQQIGGVGAHLGWFTEAAWSAAYDANAFPAQRLEEARLRLSSLKLALRSQT